MLLPLHRILSYEVFLFVRTRLAFASIIFGALLTQDLMLTEPKHPDNRSIEEAVKRLVQHVLKHTGAWGGGCLVSRRCWTVASRVSRVACRVLYVHSPLCVSPLRGADVFDVGRGAGGMAGAGARTSASAMDTVSLDGGGAAAAKPATGGCCG